MKDLGTPANTPNTFSTNAPSVTLTRYTYDPADRVLSRASTDTLEGNPVWITETWQYDGLGRVVADKNGLDQFNYTYGDGTTRVRTITSTSGPQVTALYYPPSSDGLLQQLTYASTSGGSIAQYAYQYDANRNVTSFVESGLSTTYGYDAYNQLVQANGPTTNTQYGYDLSGNLTSAASKVVGHSALTNGTNTTYGPSNEIKTREISTAGSIRRQSATYDGFGQGNLASVGDNPHYSYDSFNRLFQINWGNQLANGSQVTNFMYDGLGRLVQVVDQQIDTNAGSTIVRNHSYGWCGNVRCFEFDNLRQVPANPPLNSVTKAAVSKIYFSQGGIISGSGFVNIYRVPLVKTALFDWCN